MFLIRRFEERASELYRDGEIPGFVHLSNGQEAVPVGVCGAIGDDDVITSTHRGHGHVIAKGADVTAMFAELMGKKTGTCGGYGGSMHIADPTIGIYGANGIVGAGLPIATGAAIAIRSKGQNRVAVAFFGDGAISTGAFHESVNLAALWKLPLVLVCEANGYSEFSRTEDQQPVPIEQRALGYGIEAVRVDGTDVAQVGEVADAAVQRARAGAGPTLIVATVNRVRGHYEGDPQRYRDDGESIVDPIQRSQSQLEELSVGEARVSETERSVEVQIAAAIATARAGGAPDPAALQGNVLACSYPTLGVSGSDDGGEQTRVSRMVRSALDGALTDDPHAIMFGIDVAAGGGVFGISRGLGDSHPGRVFDTPISETAIIGGAVGAALDGLRPIVELMYLDFVGVCLDQILNQAAKMRFMTGGRAELSLVIRTQFGVGRSSGSQHSQSLEAMLAHIPGVVVVMPSSVEDHYGLLRSAIECPDPVVFIENRNLYEKQGVAPSTAYRAPLGRASVARQGEHITIVSASAAVWIALEVADELAESEGISCEVVDLRTISPWDRETVLASVAKTAHLLTFMESVTEFGVGAEIAATIAADGFWLLDSPIRRVGGPTTPVPYSPGLEQAWRPTSSDLRAAVLSSLAE